MKLDPVKNIKKFSQNHANIEKKKKNHLCNVMILSSRSNF